MSWFDILKLGGEDFGTPPEKDVDSYDDDVRDRKRDFFHNLKDVATTRPHFEWSAKDKYSHDNVEGNLREIAQKLEGESIVSGGPKSTPYMAFTAPNSNFLVSFRKIGHEENYTGSTKPARILDESGNERPAQPKDLGNTKSMILFDSVYDAYDVDRLRQVFKEPLKRFKSIWGDGDEDRLRGIMREKDQADYQALIDRRLELTAKKRELDANKEKLEQKNRNRKILPEHEKENLKRIHVIDSEIEKIVAEIKDIDNRTRRSKGRTGDRRRRRRR